MNIYLMRHGDYVVNREQVDVLTSRGEENIRHLAAFLSQANIKVSQIYHSKKHRAFQTAVMMNECMGGNIKMQEHEFIAPNDDPSQLLSEMSIIESDTLIIGHLPFMSRFTSLLILGHEGVDIIDYQTSTFVCLTEIRLKQWAVSYVLSPSLLNQSVNE